MRWRRRRPTRLQSPPDFPPEFVAWVHAMIKHGLEEKP